VENILLVGLSHFCGVHAVNSTLRHWNEVWSNKAHPETSWYQSDPAPSLVAIDRFGLEADDVVIDVGCGASHLADRLLDRGVGRLHLLDISEVALDAVRARIETAGSVAALTCHPVDVVDLDPVPPVSIWHDRAVLHFIREPVRRRRYAAVAAEAVRHGGHLIVGGFALDGPLRCSELEVERTSEDDLISLFGGAFDLRWAHREDHETPWGATQSFQWCVFERGVGTP
jgi:SAM-dependent methyltransferase